MLSGVRVAFLLILVAGTVKGSDLSDAQDDKNSDQKKPLQRPVRGLKIYDLFRGFGASTAGPFQPKPSGGRPFTSRPYPSKTTRGNNFGFDLSDALLPDAHTSVPGQGDDGFHLEDALSTSSYFTDSPTGGDCQRNVVERLSSVIENQKRQLQLLQKLMARFGMKA